MGIHYFWRCVATVTLVGFASTCTLACASLKRSPPQNAKEAIQLYEQSRHPTYDKSIVASVAYFQKYQHEKCLESANRALQFARNDKERALACAYASQALGAVGRFQEAGEFAVRGQRFDPNSTYLASLRLTFFEQAGNELQKTAAADALRQLDPSYQKKPVFLLEATVLVILAATFTYTIYAHKKIDEAPTDDAKQWHAETALSMIKVGGTVLAGILALHVTGQHGEYAK